MLKHSSCFLLANINNINNTWNKLEVRACLAPSFNSCCSYTLHAVWSYPRIC